MGRKMILGLLLSISLIISGCESIEKDYYTGTVEADLYDVESELIGKMEELFVEEGQVVKKGDKLFKVESDVLNDEYEGLKAEVESSLHRLELVKSGNRREEINKVRIEIASSSEGIAAKKKTMEKALSDLNSYKVLYESKAVSLQEVKNMQHMYDMEKSSYDRAVKEKGILQEQLELLKKGSKEEEILYYEKQYDAAKWKLEAMEKKINKAIVISPVDGTVQNVFVKEGELLRSGGKAMEITESGNLWLKIFVEETSLGKFSVGDKLDVVRDDELATKGLVYYISSIGEFTPRNLESKESKQEVVFLVKLRLENSEKFRPGMLVDVHIGDDVNE